MATSTAPTTESQAPAKTLAENVKDTLESIVVAFILAFVFRAFIVEAFVIPTGSMAVTLYGNQLTKTCSTCGFEYALGITERMNSEVHLRCPNCDAMFDMFTAPEVVRPDSGDRILVHKWPFDIGGSFLGPHRWDVTVFKDPRDGTTNFIKRLVGLPGEVVEIIDGDVYAVELSALKPELIEKMEQLRRDVYDMRGTERQSALLDNHLRDEKKQEFLKRYAEINEHILPVLKIQRKLPHQTIAQDSLWFNVYDNDFFPTARASASGGGTGVGWRAVDPAASKGWGLGGREFRFKAEGADALEIQFGGKEIDDFYAYNNIDGFQDRSTRGRQFVGDVRLRFEWYPDAGDGSLRLTLNRDEDEFVARIGMDGAIKVEGFQPEIEAPGHRQVIGEAKLAAFAPGRSVQVEFINLDYRVALFIDGVEVIASKDSQYKPSQANMRRLIQATLRQPDGYVEVKPSVIRVAAQGITGRLRHIGLERDVYYRSQQQQEPSEIRDESGRIIPYNPYYLWPGWATAGMPMMLRSTHTADGQTFGGEYLMLGDNSPASKDSRLWWEIGPHLRRLGGDYQVGTVPDDQLIGKAFFVYWPAGYRPSWAQGVGMIPNFGKMRWIR